ncbi:MAG: hypothetical protein N2312_03785 [Dictyoglomaceae bacterium]|nr:hypothetical protein [Dictyoglomaceae bacterium]
MNFEKCPLCERVKEEKLVIYNSISKDFLPSLCKEHFYELIKIKEIYLIDWNKYKTEGCIICSLEVKIEKEFLEEFKDYYKLCLYHLKKVKNKLTEGDWNKLIDKWRDFHNHLNELIESYDYKKENIKVSSNLCLILDHLLGTGRRI